MKQLTLICIISLAAVFSLFFCAPALADVLFVYEYDLDEYLMGEQKTLVFSAYKDQQLYIDKKIRYTGSWTKRFFGKEKQERKTVHILLDRDMVRELDWYRSRITNYPLEKLSDVDALKESAKLYQEADDFLAKRYSVKKPIFSLSIISDDDTAQGYTCTHVKSELTLETEDIKKDAKSLTIVIQDLWVSTQVPGFSQYQNFHETLARRMGLQAQRLGPLNYILQYWQGSLSAIKDKLDRVKGVPVKSILSVKGSYIENLSADKPEQSDLEIKKETMVLKEIRQGKFDLDLFMPDTPFGEKTVR